MQDPYREAIEALADVEYARFFKWAEEKGLDFTDRDVMETALYESMDDFVERIKLKVEQAMARRLADDFRQLELWE